MKAPRYTDAHRMTGISYRKTDIRATFARARREQAAAAAAKVQNVTPIKRRK